MENSEKKLSFIKRVKIAIFNLEEYGTFLGEKLSDSFKYFFILILLLTLVITSAGCYDFSKMIKKAYNYISNELPEFSYENRKIRF